MSTYTFSSTNVSIAAILAQKEEKRASKVTQELKKKEDPLDLKEFKPFKPYPTTDLTVVSLEKPDAIRQYFEKIPGMSPIHPISTKVEGVRMPKESKSAVVVNMMTNSFTHSRVDGLAIAEQGNPQLRQTLDSKKLMYDVRQFCRTHYYGNGTIQGLMIRMKKQISLASTSPVDQTEFEEVCRMLPFSTINKMSGEGTTVMGISPEINIDAAAGAPYFIPGVTAGDVIEDLVHSAERYLLILKEKGAVGLQKYFIDEKDPHMHEMVVMLCPKKDVYERSDYHFKVRPFGVFPGALRILFSCLTTVIKPHMQNFLQNPQSISALGFSWAHGGAEKLLAYFTERSKIPGYHPLSWGDDQLILVVAQDGSSILTNPDVSGMDMKIDKHKFDLFKMWMLQSFTPEKLTYELRDKLRELRKQIPSENLDNKWMSCINFFIHYMSVTPVLFYKQYMSTKTKGLFSGINATTLVDQVASASINSKLSKIPIPATFTPETIQKYMSMIFKTATDIGFPFKEEETHVQLFTLPESRPARPNIVVKDKLEYLPKGEIIGLPFLGQKVAQFTFPADVTDNGKPMTILVPKCDPVPLLAGCALKTPDETDASIRAGILMSGIVGRGFNAITNVHAYNYLRSLCERHVSMNHHLVHKPMSTDVGFENLPLKEASMSQTYPSIYWYAKVFASPEEKKNLEGVTIERIKDANSVSSSTTKVNDSYAKMAMADDELSDEERKETLDDIPRLKGSAIQHALELIEDDLNDLGELPMSSATMHNPRRAVGKEAVEEPAVAKIREANEARYREKFERIRLQRQAYKSIHDKVKNYRTYQGKEEDDDFGDVDDPDLEEEIDRYNAKKESYEEDAEYERWLREEERRQREEEKEDGYLDEEEEETEEEKYYDPWAKGDFANANIKHFGK